MIKRVQIIGHIVSAADVFLGRVREITINVTANALRVHDGATVGGHEMARKDVANVPAATGANDGKMTASQAGDLSTVKSDVAAHIGAASGHPNVTVSDPGFASAADKTKLDAIETAATADQTSGDIRGLGFFDTSNDGAASGLDADLLDGEEGAFYASDADLTSGLASNLSTLRGELNAPSTTVMLFYQSAAPTGWTKDVNATLDNHALRVVTSTGWVSGSKGATAFSTVFGSGKASASHVLDVSEIPAHAHTMPTTALAITADSITAAFTSTGSAGSTGSIGGGGGHTHNLSMDLNYIDVIRCTKD